jgi:hypothetical protein
METGEEMTWERWTRGRGKGNVKGKGIMYSNQELGNGGAGLGKQ